MTRRQNRIDLEAGVYKLTQDVANPDGDGRYKYKWWLQKVFKSGTVFRIQDSTSPGSVNFGEKVPPCDTGSEGLELIP